MINAMLYASDRFAQGEQYLDQPPGLILLCHKIRDRWALWQHGHLARVRASARAMRMRMVAMEFLTWRSGLIGGAAWSITCG